LENRLIKIGPLFLMPKIPLFSNWGVACFLHVPDLSLKISRISWVMGQNGAYHLFFGDLTWPHY
jgi:hypothetical protein